MREEEVKKSVYKVDSKDIKKIEQKVEQTLTKNNTLEHILDKIGA